MSNISARNCRFRLSRNLVFFVTEKSVFTKSGPTTESRVKLPGWQVGSVAGGTAATHGETKTNLLVNHWLGLPETTTGAVISGRTLKVPVPGLIGAKGV